MTGCSPAPSEHLYENSTSGISLEKPVNWDLEFYERSGSIILEAETGAGIKHSARIEIQGAACFPTPEWLKSPEEVILRDLDRIQTLYDLGSVTLIQAPMKVEDGERQVTEAIIAIPTISMIDDPARNQVGNQSPDTSQSIEIFEIRESNFSPIMAYIYRGNSEELNTEAKGIIDSIRFICSTESVSP